MKKIGRTSGGSVIIEMTQREWNKFLAQPGIFDGLGMAMVEYRKKNKLNQEEFGNIIGLSRNRVSQVERNIFDRAISIRKYEEIMSVVQK